MSDTCCELQLNPDITGIGVRAALYAQIVLGWAVSLIYPDQFVKNSRTAYMTAIALLIASFIQLTTQNLSLLDGLVVSLTTTMMITFSVASYPSKRRVNASTGPKTADTEESWSRWFMQFCFVIFWGAWCFNMWRDPAHFGLKGEKAACPTNYSVTLWVFGREVNATNPRMRNAALAIVSIGFIIALCSLVISLEKAMSPILYLAGKIWDEKRARAPAYENPILQNIHYFLQTVAIVTLIYLVAATEKTIDNNDVAKQADNWSYGQTIALILLLQQVMDVFSTFVDKMEDKEEEEEKAKQQRGDGGQQQVTSLPMDTLNP
ncbi:Transmembrane protein [Ceratobasidium theobromae]|uniref:Transmembrane protein n=1 Tax=Ceratobasidium theobromae TaxID=1582974 RepID=A0A5N5QPI8_9AGAM|nr:Transmembrane protein [Ceratobasidium theobromae]